MVPLDLLLAVCGHPEDVMGDALDAAVQARLLAPGTEGYRFAHDLIREVAEADVGPARRVLLHRRAAEALERDASVAQGRGAALAAVLAYHYDRGQVPEKVLLYLEQAGDQARAPP